MSDNTAVPPPPIPTKQSKESLYAHTFTTAVIVVFAGLGMLTGKLHYGYFVGLCALCGGWVTPAVAGAVLMRFAESYGRAYAALPPGATMAPPQPPETIAPPAPRASGEVPAADAGTLRRAANLDFPPPGFGGLAMVAAGAMPTLRSLQGMSDARIGFGAIVGALVLLAAISNG